MLDGQGTSSMFCRNKQAQEDIYICGEKREEIFEPHFTYHGFRYVRVTGGADWKKEDFTALAISTENEVTGNFQCSDEQINQLQSIFTGASVRITLRFRQIVRQEKKQDGQEICLFIPEQLF